MNGETVKLIRAYLKMNQSQFAKHIGVTPSTIANIETGERNVSDRVRHKIAHVFDANSDDFLEYVRRYRKLEGLGAE